MTTPFLSLMSMALNEQGVHPLVIGLITIGLIITCD